MSEPFSYSNCYILDKSHFNECFEESVNIKEAKFRFFKPVILCIFGLALLLFTAVNPYAAWFIVALGMIEALSIHYRQAWWVTRQMLSKSAKGEVTLTLDEQGIHSKSFYVDSHILWESITSITHTSRGWLVFHPQGKNYVSARILSEDAKSYLNDKSQKLLASKA